jgi:radical SAM superfamily enzyme YgiQ (UPF0313 family)
LLIWPWSDQQQRTHEVFPVGLGYLLNGIDGSRYEASLLDCALGDLPPSSQAFRERVLAFRPDVVGVSWWSLNTPVVEETLEVLRRLLPGAVRVIGGPHATACGRRILRHGRVDYALAGEAELSFPHLLDLIDRGDGRPDPRELAKVPGLIYAEDGRVSSVPPVRPADLDALGPIDYRRLELEEYHKRAYYYGNKLCKDARLTAPIVTTRGCPYQCRFCMASRMNGTRVRQHSVGYVLGAIRSLYHDFGVRHVTIADDNFTFDTAWAEAVCEAICGLGLSDLTLSTPNGIRMERMTESLAAAMYRAGWREMMIAPESGSARTLRAMNKRLDLALVPRVTEMLHRVGMKVTAFFVIGFPEETLEDLALTERMILENDFDFVSLSVFQPLPGSRIFDQLIAERLIPPGFVPGHYQEVTCRPRHLEKEAVRDAYNRIWNAFREQKGLPIRNRSVATARELDVVSSMA